MGEVGTKIGVEVTAEVASHAVETSVLQGAGPATEIISGSEVLAEGIMAEKRYFEKLHELEKQCEK